MRGIIPGRRAALRRVLTPAAALLLPPLGGCAWLDERQRQLALRPTPGRPAGLPPDDVLFRPGDQRYSVPVPGADGPERLALWWLPHADPAAPALLYLHGTFRNLYLNLPKIDAQRAIGFSVLAVDYRGFGDSTPIVPSEATITVDAGLAWAELVRLQPRADRRLIFGHSLGGAVAVRLASGLHGGSDYRALALESTFTRLADVAAAAGFWGRIAASVTTLDFDSESRIGRVDAPILMLHGSADTTVPVELGRRLRDAAPPGVLWVEVPGGTHSQLHREAPEVYRQAFVDLLKLSAPASPRP
jgi:uncharacterized protein